MCMKQIQGDKERWAVISYLGHSYEADSRAEVSALELESELGLDAVTVRSCLRSLVENGLVEADMFPQNVWARLTAWS